MRLMKFIFLIFFIGLFSGQIFGVTLSTEKVGFVDLDKIFEAYPETTESKKDLANKRESLKKSVEYKLLEIKDTEANYQILISSISFCETEIEQLKSFNTSISAGYIADSTSTLHGSDVSSSSPAVSKSSSIIVVKDDAEIIKEYEDRLDDLKILKKELEKDIVSKELDIKDYTLLKERELEKLEEAYSYNLLGDIYDVISSIAARNGYSVVIDKNHVIYGEALSDITELVIEELIKRSE